MTDPWDDLPRFNPSARPSWEFRPTFSAASGQGLGQKLIEVHEHIRAETGRLLTAVSDVIEGRDTVETARSALESLSLRQSYPGLGGFCSGYCELLTIHHTLEDRQVFPGLGRAYPTLAPVLKQLHDEHEVVSELIRRLDGVLAASAGDEKARGHLVEVSSTLSEQLVSHLAYEESQLVSVLDAAPTVAPAPPAGPGSSR